MRRLILVLACIGVPAIAQDVERGRLLYETHCAICHSEKLHERQKSKIKTLSDLRDEVARWAQQTRQGFTLDETEEIVGYLNSVHYRLDPAIRKN
jgi:mono/diheme cytochrome c family protein